MSTKMGVIILRMGSGRANPLTLSENRYKKKHNLVLGDLFWYQNPPFNGKTIKMARAKRKMSEIESGPRVSQSAVKSL